MKRYAFLLFSFFLFGTGFLRAQEDSLQIGLAQLDWRNLQNLPQLQSGQKVSAASRSLKSVKELPFPVYVITREEIKNNGYITLVDALKMLPGIRVSQPGSALEGETFMMRGLSGNSYAKIMIDGVPIKPYITGGMPIGGQLPVQQAERIEVIYGPAAALYGGDAAAGIINIVTQTSERPVFTNASLHLGSNEYSSINLVFGGKLGRGKRILRFKIMGTNTRMSDRDIFYDTDSLYNIEKYASAFNQRLELISNSPNLIGQAGEFVVSQIPHLSRAVSLDLSYSIFSASVRSMFRQDHSSIGLSPLAVSYANPLNMIGETITEGNLKAEKVYDKFSFQATAGFLNYEMDNRSSTSYVNPVLNTVFATFALDSLHISEADSLLTTANNSFFSRSRFSAAHSLEYYIENTFSFRLFDRIEVTTGSRLQFGHGQPLIDFQPIPLRNDREPGNVVSVFDDPDYREYSGFAQMFIPFRKWNILLGSQYLFRNNSGYSEEIRSFNPRVAILYKASKKLSLRVSHSTAFKVPSPFLNATSYTVQDATFDRIVTGINPLNAERSNAFEAGFRWDPNEKMVWNVGAFYMKTKDFVSFEVLPNPNFNTPTLTLGYFNNDKTEATLMGIQSMLSISDLLPQIHLDAQWSFNLSRGKESFLAPENTINEINHIDGINSVRAYPDLISQLRLSFRPLEKMSFILDNIWLSKSITRNIILIEQDVGSGAGEDALHNPGYYTLDITGNYRLSDNFQFYAKAFNVFNRKYAGIDANSTPDILFYNPQPLFHFRFGLSYHLD